MTHRRRALFALLVSAIVLLGLEGAVRLLGLADDDVLLSPLLFQQPLLEPRADDGPDGWRILGDGPMRRGEAQGFRVLVVGGSAADGVGATPFGRFSHLLERRLIQQRPGHPVEVINLARAGLGSRHVVPVLEGGLADLSPQLVIVYSGNNELHELRALKHSSPAYRANLEGLRRQLHGLHGYRLLQRLLGRDRLQPVDDGPAFSPGLPDLPTMADDDDRALARRIYREQLHAMIRATRDAGARVMLATVADNRADWSGDSDRELSAWEQDRLDALAQAVGELDTQAAQGFAAEIEAAFPSQRALFEAGRSLLDLGETEHARVLLELAELMDVRPTRGNRELREVVRELAAQEGTGLCDLAELLDGVSERGVAGHDLFTDGCHLNATGQRAAAMSLATCTRSMGLWEPLERPVPLPVDPFRLDHDLRSDGEAFPPLEPEPLEGLQETQSGHAAFATGRPEQARAHYQAALEAGAPEGPTALNLALVHWHLGQLETTAQRLEQASEAMGRDPELDNLRVILGL